jgi:uncharacterized protein (UPF0332 family)
MLADDLLEQAAHLARKEPRRPKQASLRRAVSTAYYALFHALTGHACRFLVSGRERREVRMRLARGFDHRRMLEASQAATANHGGPCKALLNLIPTGERFQVARTFIDLQQARHDADYDLSKRYTRSDALTQVSRAEIAVRLWDKSRATRQAEAFMVAMLIPLRRA